ALASLLRRQDGRAAERRPVERDARGVAPDDRVQADHRLEADAEARLDEDDLVLRVAGAFGLEQVPKRTPLRVRTPVTRRDEDRELVRVDVERVAEGVLRGVEPRHARLRVIIQFAAPDYPAAPEHGLRAEPRFADEEPAAQLIMFENQRRRLPRALALRFGRAVRGSGSAHGARPVARAATSLRFQSEAGDELSPESLARAAQIVETR